MEIAHLHSTKRSAVQVSHKPLAMTGEGREIDRLVYELYGLTEDEIRIVEGS